jgi:hypothetical protein
MPVGAGTDMVPAVWRFSRVCLLMFDKTVRDDLPSLRLAVLEEPMAASKLSLRWIAVQSIAAA